MLNLDAEAKEIYIASPCKKVFVRDLDKPEEYTLGLYIASTYANRLTRRTSISFSEFYQMRTSINLQLHVITLLMMSLLYQ